MTRPRVFIARAIPEAGLVLLRACCDVEVWPGELPPPHETLREKLAACDGAITLLTDRVDAALLDAAPRLRVVSNFAVGYNNVDVAAAAARGVRVGNTPDVLTDATADMAVALLLAAARRLPEGAAAVRAGAWKTWEPLGHLGCDLAGRTFGIVGMGRIGLAVARRLHGGWGMRVLYASARPSSATASRADAELGARRVPLDALLREADFVSLHAALNDATRGLIGARELVLMKPSAVLVNTSRGELVDQGALCDALAAGRLFAAALDVTDPEPLPPAHPLLALPNVLITPHIASATAGARDAMARLAAENVLAALAGRPMPAEVTPPPASDTVRAEPTSP